MEFIIVMTENLSDIKNRLKKYIADNTNIAGDRTLFYIIQDMIALSEIELAKTAISYLFKGNNHLRKGNILLAVLYMQIAIKSHDKKSFNKAEKIFQSKPSRLVTDKLFSFLRAEYYIEIKDFQKAQNEIKQLKDMEDTLSVKQKEKLNALIKHLHASKNSVGIL